MRIKVDVTPDLLIAIGEDLAFMDQGVANGENPLEYVSPLTALFLQNVVRTAEKKAIKLVEIASAINDAAEQTAKTLNC